MNRDGDFVLLETLRKDKHNKQNLLFTQPVDVITCHRSKDVAINFRQMEKYLHEGFYLAGFFSYELGYALEESFGENNSTLPCPLLSFGVFEKPARPKAALQPGRNHYRLSVPHLAASLPEYRKSILKIKNLIARGQTYQINYTTKYSFDFTGDVFDFYSNLKTCQKVSYSALVFFGGNYILSLSPELFFRIDRGRKIAVKPMKGTATLDTPSEWLRRDPKNTSENVMIVDLLRNDLGRICKPGSVKVQELFTVEEYETLLQMTSTVTGKLKEDTGLFEIVRSLFPCGSVTGAPKIQSMKIIRDLEKEPRNIYTGAIGYFSPSGEATFNVAIRTVELNRKSGGGFQAAMGVGGGIVFDSRPDDEYHECQLKAKFLMEARPDFALIETMLLEKGRIRHLNRHLMRMKASARYFSIPCPMDRIKAELNKYIRNLNGSARLRMLLQSTGDILFEHAPVPRKPENPVVALSEIRTHSGDLFLCHKTTHRGLYDEEYRKYSTKGYFDVLFKNEKQQITEGAISNIFIERKNRWYTPMLACGLLGGIERQAMIRKYKAKESILYEKDLRRADRIILTNSVRGITEVALEK